MTRSPAVMRVLWSFALRHVVAIQRPRLHLCISTSVVVKSLPHLSDEGNGYGIQPAEFVGLLPEYASAVHLKKNDVYDSSDP